jgi:uncharacterized membrane protein
MELESMQNENPENMEPNRERRIMNTILNTSVILMGTLMGGFSELMVNATGEMASGMAEAFSGEEAGKEIRHEVKQKLPEVNNQMRNMMSDMRKDIYAQMEQKQKELLPFLADPVFDEGLRKVDSYDFGIPKLSAELDDDTLAQYTYLLVSEDATFAEFFQGLTDWMNSLPSLPGKTEDK